MHTVQSTSEPLRHQRVVTFRVSVINTQHLCPLDIVEPPLPVCEGAFEQAIDLASVHPPPAYLAVVHPVPHLTEVLPHLVDLNPPLVPLVKACKRLEEIMLPVQVEQPLSHHGEELCKVDSISWPSRPAWA